MARKHLPAVARATDTHAIYMPLHQSLTQHKSRSACEAPHVAAEALQSSCSNQVSQYCLPYAFSAPLLLKRLISSAICMTSALSLCSSSCEWPS